MRQAPLLAAQRFQAVATAIATAAAAYAAARRNKKLRKAICVQAFSKTVVLKVTPVFSCDPPLAHNG